MNRNICRCCLLENPPYVYDIFDESLWFQLKECLPAELIYERNDELPRVICDSCCLRVHEIYEFRQRCIQTDFELKRRSVEIKNKAVEDVLGLIEQLREQDNRITNNNKSINETNKFNHINCDNDDDISSIADILNEIPEVLYSDNSSSSSNLSDLSITNLLPETSNLYNETSLRNPNANLITTLNNDNLNSLNKSITTNSNSNSNSNSKNLFQCSVCEKKFTRNFQLKLHLMSIHQIGDGLRYNCDSCSKIFASLHSLNYHRKSQHLMERPFICIHCQRQFILRSQLTSHLRIHTGEMKPRLYECPMCDKRWPTKSDLKTHLRSHDPEPARPYRCDKCSKCFFTRGHLNSHCLVHTGEKPFTCEFCDRAYQNIGNLNNHMIRRHTDEVEYKLNEIENAKKTIEF